MFKRAHKKQKEGKTWLIFFQMKVTMNLSLPLHLLYLYMYVHTVAATEKVLSHSQQASTVLSDELLGPQRPRCGYLCGWGTGWCRGSGLGSGVPAARTARLYARGRCRSPAGGWWAGRGWGAGTGRRRLPGRDRAEGEQSRCCCCCRPGICNTRAVDRLLPGVETTTKSSLCSSTEGIHRLSCRRLKAPDAAKQMHEVPENRWERKL